MIRFATITVIAALTSGLHARVGAQTSQTPGARPVVARVISLRPYFRELRSVQALRGNDTLTFLFDTGGGVTVISPSLAASAGCRPYGRQVGHRMNGEPVEFQSCDSISFALGGWVVHHAPVAVFDVNALLPASLPKLDGVLSLETFRGQVITIDWSGSRLIVHPLDEIASTLARQGLPARFATGDNGRTLSVIVPVRGQRGPLWFLLDSGDIQGTLVDPNVFRDSLLVLQPDSTIVLGIGDRPAERLHVTTTSINLDGVLGTAYLLKGPVSIDLRSVP